MALRLVTRRCKLRNEPFPVYFVTLPYELYTSLYYKFPLTIVFVKWEFFFWGGAQCDARYSASGLFKRARACVGFNNSPNKVKSNNELQRVF